MLLLVCWWPISWYAVLSLPFFFLFNIKFWLNLTILYNSFSLDNYYFYFFILKVVQQYHLFLKVSYVVFFIIMICYLTQVWQLINFIDYERTNHKILYWFNLFFYLYVFIGIVWTFIEPSWVNWWVNENIEELMLCIIFFYFIGYTHFCQFHFRFWFTSVVYLLCLFYWVEQHNTLFNSRHLKLLFYVNLTNFSVVIFYKKFFSFFYYTSAKTNYFFNLWEVYNFNYFFWLKGSRPYLKQKKINYYFFLFVIIIYFNILIFMAPTFLNFWQINFLLDSYYYDIVYLWLLIYTLNYNFFKFGSFLPLIDCSFLISVYNKFDIKDLIHIIFFFILLVNFALVYWDGYVTTLLSEKLNSIFLHFTKEFVDNFFTVKTVVFTKCVVLKIKYMQVLEYLFILWSINLFIIKFGAWRLTFTAILPKKLAVRFLWQRPSLTPIYIHLALLVLGWFRGTGKFLFYILI